MRKMRLRDSFAGQPPRCSQGKGGKYKPVIQLPRSVAIAMERRRLDADGLIERALDGDVPDVEGFVFEALRTLRKLWSSLDDGTEKEPSRLGVEGGRSSLLDVEGGRSTSPCLLDQVKRSGTSDRRRTTCLRATHRQK